MKTTKRVIKIPASRGSNKFLFQPIDRLDIMFPFDVDALNRKLIEPRINPLKTLQDFNKEFWADDMILLLKPISDMNLSNNLNMAAKFAYHNKRYSECLKLLLDNLKTTTKDEQIYLTHTVSDFEEFNKDSVSRKNDELKIVITNVISKRIKDISLTILNEETYPVNDNATYLALPCCCDELGYLSNGVTPKSVVNITERNLSISAANIIDKCISTFPVDIELWETCFRYSKNFYLDNNLSVVELEKVLCKYMETNATTMAAAIMNSKDCAQYNQILSPKFYLNMCSNILDTWG